MRLLAAAVVLAALIEQAPLAADLGEDRARAVANGFGAALTRGDASLLASILPDKGKVRARLGCLSPEDGAFSPSQVQALFADFLRQRTVRNFSVTRVDRSPEHYAFVRTEADLVSADGRVRPIEIHLTLHAEDGRWILREVRASPP
jgi:hypothetical protein